MQVQNHWTKFHAHWKKTGNAVYVSFDIVFGKAMTVNEAFATDLPVPANGIAQVNIPTLLMDENGLNRNPALVAVTSNGEIIVGQSCSFKQRIIANFVYFS